MGTATLKNNIIASNIAGDDPTDGGVSDPSKQPGSDLYDITEGSTYATEGYNIVGTNDSVALTFPASPDNNGDGDPDEDTYNANMDIVGIGRQDGNPNRIQPSLGSLNNNSDEATPTRPLLSASPAIDMGENTDITGDQIRLDQRGFLCGGAGASDAQVDIGAYEFESEDAPTMLVINEVDAVTTGDVSEFVELKNTGDYPLQLADHALVIYDGSDDASCYSTNLQPELQPGQLFVLGDTTVVEGAASKGQFFAEAHRYEACGPNEDNSTMANNTVDAETLPDASGAVAVYNGKASDYPLGAVAGQNADTREDVVVYDGTSSSTSGSAGTSTAAGYAWGASFVADAALSHTSASSAPGTASRAATAAMDANSLCGAFGFGSGCATDDNGSGSSVQRNDDGSTSSGTPSPGGENTTTSQRATFIVNDLGDDLDAAIDGTCDADDTVAGNQCTLRAAIQEANADAATDNIDFSVSGTIDVGSSTAASGEALPTIAETASIDAGSQDVTVDGVQCTEDNNPVADGGTTRCTGFIFDEGSAGSTLRNLAVQNFSGNGVLIASSNNTIDMLTATGNDRAGLRLRTLDANTGTVADNNTVENSTLTGNRDGVRVSNGAASNVVRSSTLSDNVVTTTGDADGGRGVQIESGAVGNTIRENTITGNDNEGIEVRSEAADGNTISQNSISENGDINTPGIDLADNGPSANDAPDDPDTGPNQLQNFPEISATSYDESTNTATVTYSVPSSTTNSAYPLTVEFFRAGPDDEGATFLATDMYETSEAGQEATFSFTTSEMTDSDDQIVATATDADGNTSEFTGGAQPLPVELAGRLEVASAGSDDGMLLTWRTLTEENSRGFIIDRRQSESDPWARVDFIESRAPGGTSTEAIGYEFTDTSVPFEAEQVTYRLRQQDRDDTETLLAKRTVEVGPAQTFSLRGNFPNPMRSETTIRYTLAGSDEYHVTVEVFDALGRKVRTLVDQEQSGRQQVTMNAGSLASGTYFYRITAGEYTALRQLVLVR